MHLQVRAFVVSKLHVFLQRNSLICFVAYIPWLRIKGGWCFPVGKFHLRTWSKVQRELTAFWSQPKAVFPSIGIHVRIGRSGECFIVHPTKAQPFITIGGGGEHFSLVLGR